MILLNAFTDKALGIFGLGPSGLATIAALKQSGADVFCWDESPKVRKRVEQLGITCTPPKEWPWAELSALVPGMEPRVSFPFDHKILKKAKVCGVPVMSDVELVAQEIATMPENMRPRIVGVTGSNGKSFTTELIVHMICDVGGVAQASTDRGVQVLELDPILPDRTYVIEIPARKLAWTRSLKCDVGILLNALPVTQPQIDAPEMLVRLLTRIFRYQTPTQTSIIGTDDTYGQKICTALMVRSKKHPETTGTIVPVSGEATIGEGVFCLANRAFQSSNGKTNSLGGFERAPAIIGPHLNQNAAAALAAGSALGLMPAQMMRGLHSFDGSLGAFRYLGCYGAVQFYDDSGASNIGATAKSMSVNTPLYWVGGGEMTDQNFRKLCEQGEALAGAFVFGDAGAKIETDLSGVCQVKKYDSHLDAIRGAIIEATKATQSDPETPVNVLYSPGCPVKIRGGGQVFSELVSRFLEGSAA